MTALLTLGLFCAVLLVSMITGISLIIALLVGLLLFSAYAIRTGFSPAEVVKMIISGIMKVKNILIAFVLIGMLTALWRAAGTIPVIVSYASGLIIPKLFVPAAFILCSGIAVLTGTSFGTASTMGVICASIGTAMGIDPMVTGGAVLSGCYVGDRCSPVSTSALLVAEVTDTNIFDNIRGMLRRAAVPFALSCAAYFAVGLAFHGNADTPDMFGLFGNEFVLSSLCVLPAAAIVIMAVMRVNVKLSMLVSILTAIPICLFVQHTAPLEMLRFMLVGFTPSDSTLCGIISGGGITSMFTAGGVVMISASFSDIFNKTGLLDDVKAVVERLAESTTPFCSAFISGVLVVMIACNQTLSTIVSNSLLCDVIPNKQERALTIEDTIIVVCALVPWNIAGAVPLSAVGAPTVSVVFAFYLYFLPLWQTAVSFYNKTGKRLVK